MEVWCVSREAHHGQVGPVGSAAMDGGGIDAVGASWQQAKRDHRLASPSRCPGSGLVANRDQAGRGLADILELDDEVMAMGAQLDLDVLAPSACNEDLDDLVLPESIGGAWRSGWWRIVMEGSIHLEPKRVSDHLEQEVHNLVLADALTIPGLVDLHAQAGRGHAQRVSTCW